MSSVAVSSVAVSSVAVSSVAVSHGPALGILVAALAGCSSPSPRAADSGGATTDDDGVVTWHQDVAPIFGQHCTGCHHAGSDLSTFTYDSYEGAVATARYALDKIEGDDVVPYSMPPFPPPDDKDGCTPPLPFQGDPRLSDADKARVRAWYEQGMPEGDPATATPFEPQPSPVLEGDDVVDLPGIEVTVPPRGRDGDIDFNACFSMKLDLDHTQYLDAVSFVEDHRGIIHHVIISIDPLGDSAPEGDDDGTPVSCNHVEMRMKQMLTTWTEGQAPLVFPPDSGFPVMPGARVAISMHYHQGDAEVLDVPHIAVRLREEEPTWLAYMDRYGGASKTQTDWQYTPGGRGGWVDPPFTLPAGAEDQVNNWREDHGFDWEELQEELDEDGIDATVKPADWLLWAVFPHMHYAGREIRIALQHTDGTETCLADIGPWDFEWQQNYVFAFDSIDELPVFRADDTVDILCHYNNTMDNERLADALLEEGLTEPVDMTVGEDGLDEMCVMHYGVLRPMSDYELTVTGR